MKEPRAVEPKDVYNRFLEICEVIGHCENQHGRLLHVKGTWLIFSACHEHPLPSPYQAVPLALTLKRVHLTLSPATVKLSQTPEEFDVVDVFDENGYRGNDLWNSWKGTVGAVGVVC